MELSTLSGQSVAVTGASGFLGSHLVRHLVGQGARVAAISRQDRPPRLAAMNGEVTVCAADVCDPERLATALAEAKPAVVFHLAAYGVQSRERDATRAVEVNVHGAVAVVDAAAASGARLFVHVGTSHEYGGSDAPLAEDAPLRPAGVYGASKGAGHSVGRARALACGLRWIGLRPFVMYGPDEDDDKLVPYVITRALRGEAVLTSAGAQVRDLVFVEDVTRGIALAALADLPSGEVINLGSGQGLRLADLIQKLAALFPDIDLRMGERPLREDDVTCQVADTRKQHRLLPQWRPAVSLDTGLRRTVAWYPLKTR